MNKPEYIKNLEKTTDYFSVLNIGEFLISGDSINETNYDLVYTCSSYLNDKIVWKQKILKTKHGFYLYLKRHDLYKDSLEIDVYHKPEQLNELIIFIKQLVKQNKK
jgi:hypothetical protein